jgi:transketolase
MPYSTALIKELQNKANTLRKNVIISIGEGNFGHLGGSFSAADIVAALYFYKMNIDPGNPKKPDRDRFLLSKGHVAVLQYSALAELGYFPHEELKRTKYIGSMLQGHPDLCKTPGIEASTGSLGQGLSIGLGLALGLRIDGITSNVYVLIGDGELAEGQNWEAAIAASVHKADKLVAIIDKNNAQAMGRTAVRFPIDRIGEKWEACGWRVLEIDGHNMEEIVTALDNAAESDGRPTVIIANTVKGKGFKIAEEQDAGFHNVLMTKELYHQALELFEKER